MESSLVTSDRTQESRMKLLQGQFSLGIREKRTERVLGLWSTLPREVLMAPTLSGFKEHPSDAPCHMV